MMALAVSSAELPLLLVLGSSTHLAPAHGLAGTLQTWTIMQWSMQFSHGHQLSLILLGWTPCQTKLWLIPDGGYFTRWRGPGAEHGEIQCAFVVWDFLVDLLSWLVEPCGNPLLPILVEVGLWSHAILAELYDCVESSFHGVEPSRNLHSFSNLHYIVLFSLMYSWNHSQPIYLV